MEKSGASINCADEVWILAFGKGIKSKGEIQSNSQYYSNQIAASIAKMLGVTFNQGGESLDFVIKE
jgi:phosphopentomutase